jgi:hypothetical protein
MIKNNYLATAILALPLTFGGRRLVPGIARSR